MQSSSGLPRHGTLLQRTRTTSVATSSTTSSPVSDTSVPTRSWASILVPERRSSVATDETNAQYQQNRTDRITCTSKRTAEANIEDNQAAGHGDTSTESEPTQPKRKYPKRKHRKGTHTFRKEEKERLLKEMEILQQEMEALKKRALDPSFQVDQLVRKSQRQILQEGLQGHQQKFCKALSIMSDYTLCNAQAGTPLQEKILLKKDTASRLETLQAMKVRKLKNAEQFLQGRRSELDPFKALTEDQRFETETGNFTSVHFSVTQFEGVRSVKQIFDLVIFYFYNMEISVSEKLDSLVTIRENDDDTTVEGITQNCSMSTTTNMGKKMESNTLCSRPFVSVTI